MTLFHGPSVQAPAGWAKNNLTVQGGAALVGFKRGEAGAALQLLSAILSGFMTPELFGAVGDNVTDDLTAFNNCIAAVSAAGGGEIRCQFGKSYKLTQAPIILANVVLNLNGATINLNLSGASDQGFRLRNNATLRNGFVNVISTGSPGAQAGIHSPVTIGPLNGNGGTSGAPSADEGVYGWTVKDLTVSTNRAGKVGVQVFGNAHAGLIENIVAPDNAFMAGVVHLDWGFIGVINSAASSMATNRTNFDAGTAWTTHPHNIIVRNIKAGLMTGATCDVIRLSGCYNVVVEGVDTASTTQSNLYVTAGDLGFEFALAAEKPLGCRGGRYRNMVCHNSNNGWGYFVDHWADNVAAAVTGFAYVPRLDPLMQSDDVLQHCRTVSNGGAAVISGFRIQNTRGTTLEDCEASGHLWGVQNDIDGHNVKILRGRYWNNRQWGIYFNGSSHPRDCSAEEVLCDQNGSDGGSPNHAGIVTDGCDYVKIVRCRFGLIGANDPVQKYGILINSVATLFPTIRDNHVNSTIVTTGIAYGLLTSKDYGFIDVFEGNTSDATFAANAYSGVDLAPYSKQICPDGTTRRLYRGSSASLTLSVTPTAGTWVVGDRIEFTNPAAASAVGSVCTVAGSPGTWKAYGVTI